jgi:hypothetical protein
MTPDPDKHLQQKPANGPSGLLGATFACVLIFLIWVGATLIAVLPATGNPDPGDLNKWATGWFIVGLVGVALVGVPAWAIAPRAPVSSFALGVDFLAVVAAIAAAVLLLAYQSSGGDGGHQQSDAYIFVLVFGLVISGPLAAWVTALITRSSGRSLVVMASATAIISLTTNLFITITG